MSDIKDWREFIGLIKDLFGLRNETEAQKNPKTEADKKERIKCLELAIEEQRRDYDVLHSLHEGVKVKNITFLAAALALLGYLYTGNKGNLKEKLFIPSQAYGVVFYVAGALLLLGAVAGLITALVRIHPWQTAYDNEQEDDIMNNYEKYLRYMKKRYLKVSRNNGSSYENRRKLLNNSFWALLVGGTILLLIKTFGG